MYLSDNNTITGNTLFENRVRNAYIRQSSSNNFTYNNILGGSGTSDDGVHLLASNFNIIKYNNFSDGNGKAIFLEGSDSNYIIGNNFTDNGHAIWSQDSEFNEITNNNVCKNHMDGIYLRLWSDNNSIINNSICENDLSGIYFDESSNNTIIHNNISSNGAKGIYLLDSISDSIEYNEIQNNAVSIVIEYRGSFSSQNNLDEIIQNSGFFDVLIEFNNIYNNNFQNNQSQNVKAENNYWGTSNETEIAGKIFDCEDNANYGCVDFIPYLTEPWSPPTPIALNLSLREGWNLISVPLNLEEKSFDYWLNGIDYDVFSYNNGSWFIPTEIDTKIGYWVKLNESINLSLVGTEAEDKTIDLNEGWNLIGYSHLNETNISELFGNATVYTYNNSQWYSYDPDRAFNTLNKFIPGFGYWVNAKNISEWGFD